MTDNEELTTIRIEWDAADGEVAQAAAMIAFYAAYPSAAADSSELDDFRL